VCVCVCVQVSRCTYEQVQESEGDRLVCSDIQVYRLP
jgi:hypothetical protein